MKINTDEGLSKGMPLSDIQRYNRTTKLLKLIIILFGVPLFIITALILWIIWYIIKYNVLGNILYQGLC